MKLKLLLLSGLCTDETIWSPQVKALSEGFDVSVVNFSELDNLSDMVEKVKSSCEGEFYMAGISMGGWVAQKVACEVPDRVLGMILINTWLCRNEAALKVGPELLKKLSGDSEEYEQVLDFNIKENSFADINKIPPDVVESVYDMKRRLGPEVFKRHLEVVLKDGATGKDLEAVHCPVLVLYCDKDKVFSLEQHEKLANVIPEGRLEQIPDVGHLATLEAPEQVNESIENFFVNLI